MRVLLVAAARLSANEGSEQSRRYMRSGEPWVIRGNDRYSISDGQYRIVTSRARPL
ncbi:MAG: hypothetical protein WKF94_02580 [Solirubrobacteraceae bacterium]